MAIIAEDGVWTVPEGTRKIRVVLVGGGEGGRNEASGSAGNRCTYNTSTKTYTPGAGGAGGKTGGAKGNGGKILEVMKDVTPGDTFQIRVGVAGTSGGGIGGDTTFGDSSSAAGAISSTGYTELVSGVTYALPGPYDGTGNAQNGADGTNSGGFSGDSEYSSYGKGGKGGNSGSGASGQDGATSYPYSSGGGRRPIMSGRGGNGGAGARGADGATYGSGGAGGSAGGGGGGTAGAVINPSYSGSDTLGGFYETPTPGTAGQGGAGGQGAKGCVIIYY